MSSELEAFAASVRQLVAATAAHDVWQPGTHVDDDDGDAKDVSWWGVQWPEPHSISRVRFTTGPCTRSGGWFVSVPRVEFLGADWYEAPGQLIDRAFVVGADGTGQTYTIDFTPEDCHGVRIVGAAGGDRRYTSLAAFSAFWEPAVLRDPGFEHCREPWGIWRFEGGVPREIVRDAAQARSGQRCALLGPVPATGRHGIAQAVALRPGQRLEVAAWIRATGDVASVYVGLRFGAIEVTRQLQPTGGSVYERISHRLEVPADCTTGEVIVGMDAVSDGARLLVDDVAIQQLPGQTEGPRHA